MPHFENVSLVDDPSAARYVKEETVDVAFAEAAGALMSREGLNHFKAGDAQITGSTGDRWSVSRPSFEQKYEGVDGLKMGANGRYRARPVPVFAKQVFEPFTVRRRAGGDILRGNAGDWLMQYGPDEFGLTEDARFKRVYRRIDPQ
jgi:hypothetical protein